MLENARRYYKENERWLLPAATLFFALCVLLPRLGHFGLWDPDDAGYHAAKEISIADDAKKLAHGGNFIDVYKTQPPLTMWLIASGIKVFGVSELGARLPLALVGALGVLATYFLGARLRSRRAGFFGAVVLVASPLFLFQARQLTSSIGGASAQAIALLGLVGLAWPEENSPMWRRATDPVLALIGLAMGFFSSGLFVGVFVPIAGVAAALAVCAFAKFDDAKPYRLISASVFAVASVVVGAIVLLKLYHFGKPQTGQLVLFGKSLTVRSGYIPSLAGTFHDLPADTATFDYVINQLAFGMFPWSALAPVAMLRLAFVRKKDRNAFGGLVLVAWALFAYLVCELFLRKSGEVRFPAMAAIALACGVMIDDILAARFEGQTDRVVAGLDGIPGAALFALLAGLELSRDLQEFPESLSSIHLLGTLKFPVELRWLSRAVLVLGGLFAATLATGLAIGVAPGKRLELRRKISLGGTLGAVGVGYLFAIFLSTVYTPALSQHLSYKNLFESYQDHRVGDEPLCVMGIPGSGPDYYAHGAFQRLNNVNELLAFLGKPERSFCVAPANQLCPIRQAAAATGQEYHVLDNRNSQYLLLGNNLREGEHDQNPLLTAFQKEPPATFSRNVDANFEDTIELIGIDMPDHAQHGDLFKVTLWFRVKQRPKMNYKIFMHFDGAGVRFQGDHDPIENRCGTTYWQVGDIIADTFDVQAGQLTDPRGQYDVFLGFFTGGAGQWKNMEVKSAEHDSNNRVPIGKFIVD